MMAYGSNIAGDGTPDPSLLIERFERKMKPNPENFV